MSRAPFPSFQDASDAVLAFLQQRYPMGLWMVTRTVGEDWIVLRAEDRSYDVAEGDLFRWSDSFCSRMVRGEGPHIAPDSQSIPAYAQAPIGQQIPIASYIGFPLEADGELFGTLCAIDTEAKPLALIEADEDIALLARLLTTILQTDIRANQLSVLAQAMQDAAHRDALTDVLNRRGWERLMAQAEANRVQYGQAHCIVVADLNGLKGINDARGHAAGDAVLLKAAQTIIEVAGREDVVVRFGGDEFGVLLEEPQALAPESFVARLRDALHAAQISVALGFAVSGPGVSLEHTLARADAQMYLDKRAAGR